MYLRAQSACYELKKDLSPITPQDIFHDSLKNILKFTRICIENHSSMSGWQKWFFFSGILEEG